MKHEYHEGPKALATFEKGMARLFQASKDSVKEKPTPSRKRKKASKG